MMIGPKIKGPSFRNHDCEGDENAMRLHRSPEAIMEHFGSSNLYSPVTGARKVGSFPIMHALSSYSISPPSRIVVFPGSAYSIED